MLQRLRYRVQGQEGFTLIELLVVILIIGILAAVAIPTFLSQRTKATDSNVISAISTAQTTESTYQSSNNTFVNASGTTTSGAGANPLLQIEPTLSNAFDTVANGGYVMTVTAASTTAYTIQAQSPTTTNPVTYTLTYDATTGKSAKSCTPKNTADCNASGSWGSGS